MKSFFTTLLLLTIGIFSADAQTTAKVQLIHNSPDQAVDIYLNGFNALNDVAFRTATALLDLPAGLPLDIAVAPANSASVADAFISFNYTLEPGRTYVMTAIGVPGSSASPFSILNDANGRSDAPTGKVGISVIQGAPDAPAFDMAIRTGSKIVANLAYGQFTPYFEIPNGDYFLDLKPVGQQNILATYRMDLTGLSGKSGKIMTSGYFGGNSPTFGVYAIWTNGQVDALPVSPVARVQLIHNAPGLTMDVYKNNGRFADNMEFRMAKEYFYIPAGSVMNIGVAPASSVTSADTILNVPYTFQNGKTYLVVAHGLEGDPVTPLTLSFNDLGNEVALDSNLVDVVFFHGATNAPEIDVQMLNGNVWFNDVAYGEFSPFVSATPVNNTLQAVQSDNNEVVSTYELPLADWKGKSVLVFASGFLNQTPGFGLWAAESNGMTYPLPVVSSTSDLWGVIRDLTVVPNPVKDDFAARFSLDAPQPVSYTIFDQAGQVVGEGDWGSQSNQVSARISVDDMPNGLYLLQVTTPDGVRVVRFVVQK